MANPEESSPLLSQMDGDDKVASALAPAPAPAKPSSAAPPPPAKGCAAEWTADGVPMGHVSVVGEPVARNRWDSGLFSCLGRNDEFCSSDLEVCLLGSFAPCVLYGSNVERLSSGQGSFANNCLPYTGLYCLGNSLFGWNCIAPWFAYPARTAIRHKFNLEGSFEAFTRSCGCCCQSMVGDEAKREQVEMACDFLTHYMCHPCALCQEARELRRRLPHPGFNARSVLVMMPPMEQTMGRSA
ncbi:cell number regulator 8 [Ananas comosus]|uniref:Cell number regulator 8 n=1 Tax=Ananas comosus TaxID=4615 RepID=A0A199VNA3_ANACO|nr:cell number regulator 8 [Ananas comosus]XP_020102557.1 cell number regulator 8 [Ananas comosus]OAY78667.1 Cell number regulator 8 [Ananas comosus]